MASRRTFFRQAAAAVGASQVSVAQQRAAASGRLSSGLLGRELKMIAFPLGGVGAGSVSLGGRGQLRDWEIFNRPNKGFSPNYALPSIWVRAGSAKPVARVLEARILPPYEGESGLGSNNAPGLSRLEGAKFTGEYPLARIDFEDRSLPVKVLLEAFSPFIPHEADESGLPVAILRYRVSNPSATPATVSIAFSIDNPMKGQNRADREQHAFRARHALSRSADRRSHGRRVCSLRGQYRGHSDRYLARLAARAMVELSDVVLGRFLRRWPPLRRARSA